MINDILRDLINTGEVAVFIDDVLVGTEEKEKHNEIVEDVLRRMEENDLYVKRVWKVREIDFLGLVMRSGEIKMQEEKVAEVLE